ncbi:MAG: diversity-generating retroelement protein Avd [Cyanobacteria bacterium P01_H01_bin.15]
MEELPIIQKTYDLIQWYVPIANRLPRSHKFTLGDRICNGLYDLFEGLIEARYAKQKLTLLSPLNQRLDILRYQSRMLLDFNLISLQRYDFACQQLDTIGTELGGWIRNRKTREHS